MRSESGDRGLLEDPELDGTSKQSREYSKISYSRDLLLSLGRTERCQNFPRDVDPSMLGEFDDACTGLLVSPLNSDSRHSGSLSQDLMRNPANDGLWGSGRCIATASSTKVQCSSNYNILHKAHNPYRPPHFYKAAMEHKVPDGKEMQPEKCSGHNDQLCETRESKEVYSCNDLEQYISSEVNEKSTNDHIASSDKGLKLTKTSSDELNLKSNTNKNSLDASGNGDTPGSGISPPRKITFGAFSAVEVQSSYAPVFQKDHVVVSAEAEFTDEINLTDEDSLFTFDYSIFNDPDEEADLLPSSSTQVDLIRKLATFSYNNPYYATGTETYVCPTMPCFQPWDSMDSRPYPNNHHWYPRNVPPYPFQQPRPWSARFESPINHSHFGPVSFPNNFPHYHLQNGFHRGLPYRPVTQLPHSPQRRSYQQTAYGGHGKQISGLDLGFGRCKNQVRFDRGVISTKTRGAR